MEELLTLRCVCGCAETVTNTGYFAPIGPHIKSDKSMCLIRGPYGQITGNPGKYIYDGKSIYRI